MADQKVVICPYCGDTQALAERCRACGGLFEPLSRQATHNAMGPWFVRDPERPFQPGCSYETLLRLVERGRVSKYTIVRGPTTRQFWTIAKHVPGISHLLGYCHQCDASVDPGDHACHACGAAFGAFLDRNYLGLPEIQPLPWEADGREQLRRPVRPHSPMWRNPGDGGEPRTISSFASDEELLGTGRGTDSSLPPSFGGGSSPAAATQEQVATATAPVRHGESARPQAGMMPSRTGIQRKRAIIVGLAAIAVIALVGLAAWMLSGSVPAGTNGTGGAAEADPPEAETAQQPAETERPRPPALSGDLRAGYERALGLLDSASDERRELDHRIADYEEALGLLVAVETGAIPQSWPTDLAERLEEARTHLDRLRLRKFFP